MELELDQGGESQNESQEEEDVQEKRGGGETTSESSEEEEQRKDARSTLISEPESDEELTPQPSSTKMLKPIPVLFDVPLSTGDVTSSANFNLDDPLGMKVMKATKAPRLQRPERTKETENHYTVQTAGSGHKTGQRKCQAEIEGIHSQWILPETKTG